MIRKGSGSGHRVDGHDDFVEDGAQQLFAFPVTGGGCGEDRPHVGAGARQPGQLVIGEPDGAAGLGGQQVTFGLPLRGQLGLQRPFQGAGDQPVLRLDRVVLAAGPVGFVAGPFHGQLEGPQRRGVGLFGVGERVRGRGQGRRLQHGEHFLQDSGLEPPSAEALAALLAAIQLFRAGAQIAGAVALVAGVAGLHHPAALAAPQPALQQRRPFPRGAATEPARRPPVGPQPSGVGFEGGPVDEPGMMVGDQHRPLLTGQHDTVRDHLAGGVDALLGAGPAEHERPGIDRVRQEVVHRRIRCWLPS